MNRSPTSVLAWRTPTDLQVGDDDGFLTPTILRDVPLRVVTALEQWMLEGASGAPFLPEDEVEHFAQLQDELRAAGHVEPAANLAPFGVLALDSAPTSAATVRQLIAAGVRCEVDTQPTPVNTPRECAHLRHEVARARLGTTLPERTVGLFTSPYLPDPARTAPLMREDQPFVCLTVGDNAVEISPVVIPGETPCPGCQETYRSERDPRRAIVAAQLRTKPVPALSAGTGMMVGALAFQVIAAYGYDVGAPPLHAIVIDRRTLQAGRRIWAFHPACPCQRPDP